LLYHKIIYAAGKAFFLKAQKLFLNVQTQVFENCCHKII